MTKDTFLTEYNRYKDFINAREIFSQVEKSGDPINLETIRRAIRGDHFKASTCSRILTAAKVILAQQIQDRQAVTVNQ